MRKPKVSIIILRYREKKEVFNCIESIVKSNPKTTHELIVVDNNKRKRLGSKLLNKYPWIKYVKSSENVGYGAGNNLGAEHAQGEYLFILNPDTEVFPNTIDELVEFLENNRKVAIAAPTLVSKKGNVYPTVGTGKLNPLSAIVSLSFINKLFPNNPISKKFWLKSLNKNVEHEVEVVPGTAFLIRKAIFEHLGGFDEKFFLYFEESDLSKRVIEQGYKLFIVPEAKVMHLWSRGIPQTDETKRIFIRSRFYYFRKHYGLLSALVVEMFTRFSKWYAALLGIFALASFLLFYKIDSLMMFIGDFAWIYLSARDMLLTGKMPLVGIASSVPVLKQGALFTWILGAALWLGKYNPISGAILTGLIGLFAVWLTYKLISTWFGKRVGVIAVLIAATSPLIVIHSRMPFETAPIFFVTLLISWSAYKAAYKNKLHFFLLGLWLSLLYQLELAGFILIPVVILALLWQKIKVSGKEIFGFIFGGFLGISPLIIWDLRQGVYLQTFGFTAWVFTKIWEGIVGFATGGFEAKNYSAGLDYLVRFIYPSSPYFAQGIALFSLGLFFLYVLRNLRNLRFEHRFIFLWLIVALSGFILRGIVSDAYMPLLFLPLIVITALFFDWMLGKTGNAFWVLIIAVVLVNSFYLIQTNYLLPEVYGLNFSERLRIADSIIEHAADKDYRLIYRGPGDYFEASDDNYQYLLWWKGNEPVNDSPLSYTLFEPAESLKGKFNEVLDFGHTKVGINYD